MSTFNFTPSYLYYILHKTKFSATLDEILDTSRLTRIATQNQTMVVNALKTEIDVAARNGFTYVYTRTIGINGEYTERDNLDQTKIMKLIIKRTPTLRGFQTKISISPLNCSGYLLPEVLFEWKKPPSNTASGYYQLIVEVTKNVQERLQIEREELQTNFNTLYEPILTRKIKRNIETMAGRGKHILAIEFDSVPFARFNIPLHCRLHTADLFRRLRTKLFSEQGPFYGFTCEPDQHNVYSFRITWDV